MRKFEKSQPRSVVPFPVRFPLMLVRVVYVHHQVRALKKSWHVRMYSKSKDMEIRSVA